MAGAPPMRLRGLFLAACAGSAGAIDLRSWDEAERMADQTLARMTALERHTLMKGSGWTVDPSAPNLFPTLQQGQYMGNTEPVHRLGVPAMKLHDAGNGFRINPSGDNSAFGSSTVWPSALACAASWDDDVVYRVAEAIGKEFKAKDANVILGPAVQVHRVAANGRNFEYMSGEDPYIGVRLTHAYVVAVQSQGIIACAKHFAFNEQETRRMDSSSDVDAQTAWEIYYPPFESAVKAGVGSFMCGYNKVNGTWDCENEKMLKGDLKGKMGFRGFVMSDWFATHSSSWKEGLDQCMPGVEPWFNHEVMECSEAGIDCEGAWGQYLNPKGTGAALLDAGKAMARQYFGWDDPRNKSVAETGGPRSATVLDPARRILAAIYRMKVDLTPGCDPGPGCVEQLKRDVSSFKHRSLAKEAALGSAVLLKNDKDTLPIEKANVKSIALIGILEQASLHEGLGMPPADFYSGGGSGHIGANPFHLQTVKNAMENRARKAGIKMNSVDIFTHNGGNTPGGVHAHIMDAVRKSDIAIAVCGTSATEGNDRGSFFLDLACNEMIQYAAQIKPVVVLMMTPGVVFMPWLDNPNVVAVMNQFLAGEATGPAFAELVFGDASPSGKMPIVFPKDDLGTTLPGTGDNVTYSEGMLFSYRDPEAAEKAAFPFGYGLSYTTFAYQVPQQVPKAECESGVSYYAWKGTSPIVACVAMTVVNTGKRPGREVTQAYVEFSPEANMPKLMLKGFKKTSAIEPGAEERVLFAFTQRDLSTYHVALADWKLQEKVTLHIGASSADIKHSLELIPGADPKPKPQAAASGTANTEL